MSPGVGGLADEQRPARALGQMRGDRPDEPLVTRIEHRLARLAVQAEHAPHFPGRRSEPGDHLLVAAHGLVEVPAPATRRVVARGLVQR